MAAFPGEDRIAELVDQLGKVGWKERETVKDEILTVAREASAIDAKTASAVKESLEATARGLTNLELRWEIEEVLEALQPEPTAEETPYEDPEGEEAPEDGAGDGKLKMSDLDMVYDDPRGLQLYKHKTQERWFAVQADPMSGQPRMFELHPSEVTQLKGQLQGSPYLVLGSGGA